MRGWADGRIVHEGSHCNVNEFAITDDRIEQRTADLAVCIISTIVAKDHELVHPFGDEQLVVLDAGKRLEG